MCRRRPGDSRRSTMNGEMGIILVNDTGADIDITNKLR